MSTTLGRISASQTIVLDDEPSQKVSAMLRKQDELITAIKALTAKIDADSGDTGGDNDYASSLTDSLSVLDLEG